MKFKIFLLICLLVFYSCRQGEKNSPESFRKTELQPVIPIDQGFMEYISGYTSGVIPSNSVIEIHFTSDFAAVADKNVTGLFSFEPQVNGKTEWRDETSLVFIPAKPLDPGKTYTGRLDLGRLANVEERLKYFPLSIQTIKKDFRITLGSLVSDTGSNTYSIRGQVITSDFIKNEEVESYVDVRQGRKKSGLVWDHSKDLVHEFTIRGIARGEKPEELKITWDGRGKGVKQKGSASVEIPSSGEFMITEVITSGSPDQKVEIVFSDPLDNTQEKTGLVHFSPEARASISVNANILTIIPDTPLEQNTELVIEPSVRNYSGKVLSSRITRNIDFTPVQPGIMAEGNGVIIPSSQDLVFPFKAANLKAADLTIIKIYENNLPYYLQENDISGGYSVKRFGRPVYSGRVDLLTNPEKNTGSWNLYTIDLADYIQVEPGVLYKVILGMRKSYSLYPCTGSDQGNYDELLQRAEEQYLSNWDDPNFYYEDASEMAYYQSDLNWRDRGNPCKDAYYSPDKRLIRNILASNLGITGKLGEDNILHITVNDLISALPVNEAEIEVYDYQMQLFATGITGQEGSASLQCTRKPFLVIVKKDKDRNYLKTTEGLSLSLSSFDVSGSKPGNGIRTFIYGERDVWRPGDSIYLSLFIKDLTGNLPTDHPVQFELINPMDQRIDNQVQKASGNDLAVFRTYTPQNAVTGNYTAVFRIGGAVFNKRVRIETIKPNRLKPELQFPGEILGGSDEVTKGILRVSWLNGSNAGNTRTSVEYLLKRTATSFEGYSQYTFDDPVSNFQPSTVTIFDEKVDESGEASVIFDPGKELNSPGMLDAVFTVRAMEPGGDESIVQTSYRYAPFPVFAGINIPDLRGRMIFTDSENSAGIVTVDEKGKPVDSDVEVTMYKLSYRWWWESDQENLGYYISNNYYKPVIRETIRTEGGKGTFRFKIDRQEWGRYLIRVKTAGGHATGKIILADWPWEYGMKSGADGATLLSLSTDKEKYSPGDEISLSFPSPDNATAIITLENSTGVIYETRAITRKGNTVVRIKVREGMAPNVYAFVSVIQPHERTLNDMPVRLYGVVPIMVEDPGTHLSPELKMDDELRSGRPFVISVRESSGKPMNYTVAIVDEGLLDITGFRTPDPWKYFFQREALGVRTWDIYDNVLGAFGGTLERILATGGDETLTDMAAGKARRFLPVVKFLGPYSLESGKTNSHSVVLPQYTGSVRAMVVAGNGTAFGSDEKSVPVRDPLMVLATAPRTVSPGEKVKLPVTLFVQKEGIDQVTLTAESNELVSFTEKTKQVHVTSTGEINTAFEFLAGEKTGNASISITASGGGEKASYSISMEVRSPNPAETRAETRILGKGERWNAGFSTFGLEGSNSASLEMSTLPSVNFDRRLDYLTSYPHGCSEQVVSAAFPQLYLLLLRKNDQGLSQEIAGNIKQAINTVVSRQMANGGIPLWPGSYQPDNWITSYSGHFMIEAERSGYVVPSSFRQKWLSYQQRLAREWRFDPKYKQTMTDQSYRLFTLALVGQPERGAMNRMRESGGLNDISRWLLSAAYALSGRPEAATELLDLRNTGRSEDEGYYYGSRLRDRAVVLYTLTLLGREEPALPVLNEICKGFGSDEWYSTQTTAWGLMAYSKWVEMMPGNNDENPEVHVSANGKNIIHEISPGQLIKEDIDIKPGPNSLEISNNGEVPVYVTVTRKGVPLAGDATTTGKGLSIQVSYSDLKMRPLDIGRLVQGTDFMMIVKVTNTTFTRVDNIALTQMMPSGWEIRNTRLFEAEYGIDESSFDYRDIRDDRVNTYFSLDPGSSKTFVILLGAAYSGEYNQPPVLCEAMYSPGIYARTPGRKVTVISEQEQ